MLLMPYPSGFKTAEPASRDKKTGEKYACALRRLTRWESHHSSVCSLADFSAARIVVSLFWKC